MKRYETNASADSGDIVRRNTWISVRRKPRVTAVYTSKSLDTRANFLARALLDLWHQFIDGDVDQTIIKRRACVRLDEIIIEIGVAESKRAGRPRALSGDGRYSDGCCIEILIRPGEVRRWRARLTVNGRPRNNEDRRDTIR